MSIVTQLTDFLTSVADKIPLPAFVFIGSLVEEIIAPIPSPIVMTLAGSLAEAASRAFPYLLFLAVFGAFAKTVGSWVIYVIADRAEDFLLEKFGKFVGVSHKEVEKMGQMFSRGKKDYFVMFLLRAIPMIPTAPVSIISGILKLNLRTYLLMTFVGISIRNVLYLYLGYSGLTTLEALNENLEAWETWGYLGLFVLVGGIVAWFYFNRDKIQKKLGMKE